MFKRLTRRPLLIGLSILLCGAYVLPQSAISAQAAAASKAAIMLDQYPLSFSASPTVVKGNTMVPFRGIAEALGIQVEWKQASQTIIATQTTTTGTKKVVLHLNKSVAEVDGMQVSLPIAPYAAAGTTYIPLSFFGTQFGAKVSWDQQSKTVSIVSPVQQMYMTAFYAIKAYPEKKMIDNFDRIDFGWVKVEDDSTISKDGKDFYWPQADGEITPESIVAGVKEDGGSSHLMVFATDGRNELTRMLEDEALRDAAIDDIMEIAIEKSFSGITLDFEGLGLSGDIEKARQDYNAFVKLLSERIKSANMTLSLALHPLNGAYNGYDYSALAKLVDDIVLMAYAYEDEKSPEPLAKVDEAIRLALKEVPKEQLLLGISMGSENSKSVNSKIGLAKRYQLKGIAVWRLGIVGEAAMKQMNNSILSDKST